MIKKLQEFNNASLDKSVGNTSVDVKSPTELISAAGFQLSKNSTDKNGLGISDSDMIAVQYLEDGTVSIVLNNDLTLDSQAVNTFKKEFQEAEKLAQEITRTYQ